MQWNTLMVRHEYLYIKKEMQMLRTYVLRSKVITWKIYQRPLEWSLLTINMELVSFFLQDMIKISYCSNCYNVPDILLRAVINAL